MVVISLAETRHDAAACLEALAEAGLKNLADPALRDAFTSTRISTLLWVRPASLGRPARTAAGRRLLVPSARAAALERPALLVWLQRPEPGAPCQAYARLNRVDAGAGRRFARALAELAMRPGSLGSNAQALGNVAWGLSVARLLDAPTLQRVRRTPGCHAWLWIIGAFPGCTRGEPLTCHSAVLSPWLPPRRATHATQARRRARPRARALQPRTARASAPDAHQPRPAPTHQPRAHQP